MLTHPSKPRPKSSTFGSSIKSRGYIVESGFRFGFNGKEKQVEFGGEIFDLGEREYISLLGKMMRIDPKFREYSWQSPYAYYANSPIGKIDYYGKGDNDDEFKEVNNTDGSKTTTKLSNLGGDKVNFTHIEGGKFNGQTKVESKALSNAVYMKSSNNLKGYTQREKGTDWSLIYEEFLNGTGPEKSLITNLGMLAQIMKSPQFKDATNAYMQAGAPNKMSYNASFGITGALEAGKNMTAQMIGKANYSFYNVGDYLVITIMDSKSVMSYSLNPLLKICPESLVNKDRNNLDTIPESTTYQTYLFILPIRKQ